MDLLKKYKITLLLTAAGILAGIGYWYFIGCNGGTCPITSNWYSSAIYGGLFGLLISDFKTKNKKTTKDE